MGILIETEKNFGVDWFVFVCSCLTVIHTVHEEQMSCFTFSCTRRFMDNHRQHTIIILVWSNYSFIVWLSFMNMMFYPLKVIARLFYVDFVWCSSPIILTLTMNELTYICYVQTSYNQVKIDQHCSHVKCVYVANLTIVVTCIAKGKAR